MSESIETVHVKISKTHLSELIEKHGLVNVETKSIGKVTAIMGIKSDIDGLLMEAYNSGVKFSVVKGSYANEIRGKVSGLINLGF